METPAPSDANEPEKYIRTFAGDMEILKKGGTPDLTPLADAETPPTTPAPPNLMPHPAESVIPIPPVSIPPKPPEISPLKTYSGDFSDRVKETQASTLTVLAAEQDAKPRTFQPPPEESSGMSLPYLIVGALLLIAGGAGIYLAYTHYLSTTAPVVVAQSIPTPIFVDEREEVVGTGTVLIQAIQASVARSLSSGTVRLLSVASTTSGGNVFSALAAVSAPDALLRNVNTVGSMAGVIHIADVQSPFFILSVVSYSDTFAGMLAWEPVMPLYLTDLFPPYPLAAPLAVASTTVATTTQKTAPAKAVASSTPALQVIPSARFFDATIANHDARVYRDATGRTVLIYGYWNHTTLVIARDPAAFAEILNRLATARTVQ